MRFPLLAALLPLLAGCASTAPGLGWARAPDLAVYEAMTDFAQLAKERDVFCAGLDRDRVQRRWDQRYGARHAWIEAALTSRYGMEAVQEAAAEPPPSVECGNPFENEWRLSYARLLRLLETRLYPEGYLG